MKKYYLLLLFICLFVCGCSNEALEVKSTSDFSNVALNNGFTYSDNINDYVNFDYITEAGIANYDDISIEFVTYNNEDSAIKVQDEQIENFELRKGSGYSSKNEKGQNYYRYVLISNNLYMLSIRVENTLIFCSTDVENKDKVQKIVQDLGY